MIEILSKIYNKNFEKFKQHISKSIRENKKEFIITVNPETIMISQTNKVMKEILQNENFILVPDGISIVKSCQMCNIKIKERITGIDITKYLLSEINKQNKSLYLFGAKKEVIDNFANLIKNKYKNIKLLGFTDGYVNDKDKVFEKIIKLKPDICLVALGIPMQEEIIYKYIDRFEKGIFIGVGGTFDVLSGYKKRAPKFFIKNNLEWLYRIAKEPKRIKRFVKYNVKFYIQILKEKNIDN